MPQLSPDESKLREIKELERQLARKKAAMGMDRPMEVSDYSIGKEGTSADTFDVSMETNESLKESKEDFVEKESVLEDMAAAAKAAAAGSLAKADKNKVEAIMQDAKAIASMDEERKIQTLAALAWQKGINYSIEVARKLEDPYTLDQLHAYLANELYDKLVSSKKLDEI
jgi:hypothetical protein